MKQARTPVQGRAPQTDSLNNANPRAIADTPATIEGASLAAPPNGEAAGLPGASAGKPRKRRKPFVL